MSNPREVRSVTPDKPTTPVQVTLGDFGVDSLSGTDGLIPPLKTTTESSVDVPSADLPTTVAPPAPPAVESPIE